MLDLDHLIPYYGKGEDELHLAFNFLFVHEELEADAEDLTTAYAAALRTAYPARPDGTTVLPFRRVFAVGRRG